VNYPAAAKVGANCLLGTKVMIPIDGPVRENVGLLGSPCFEIPRANERDKQFNLAFDEPTRQERLRRKNRHNLVTAVGLLLRNWVTFAFSLLAVSVSLLNYSRYGTASLMAGSLSITLFVIAFYSFMEWMSLNFRRLEPKVVSIYDDYFWFHERHWKWSWLQLPFKGTPFKNVISRLLGVKVGKKVFDDGCWYAENTMIEVGDYTNLNAATTVQGHSLEEGVFKSDGIKIGSGCSIHCGAYVHYGVRMGDRVVLQPDSFLMKGELLEPHSIWRGNPARAVRQKPERTAEAFVAAQRPASAVVSSAAA